MKVFDSPKMAYHELCTNLLDLLQLPRPDVRSFSAHGFLNKMRLQFPKPFPRLFPVPNAPGISVAFKNEAACQCNIIG